MDADTALDVTARAAGDQLAAFFGEPRPGDQRVSRAELRAATSRHRGRFDGVCLRSFKPVFSQVRECRWEPSTYRSEGHITR